MSGIRTKSLSAPAAIGVTLASLLVSYAVKAQCLTHPWDGFQYRRLCYNDIQPLFGVRGVSRGLIPYLDVQYEYPPLTGFFMDVMGRLLRWLVDLGWVGTDSNDNYFRLTALFLAPLAVAITLFLRKQVTGARLMIWAAGSPLILYAFHNWDLIVVAGAVWGLAALASNRNGEAGAALGVGATAKLFPAFLAPAAFLRRWGEGDRSGAVRLAAFLVVAFVVLNTPVIIAASGLPPVFDNPRLGEIAGEVELRRPNTNGWLGIWTFHAGRYPDFGTAWYWVAKHGDALFPSPFWRVPGEGEDSGFRDFVSLAGLLVFAGGSVFFLRRGWQRRGEPDGYPVEAVGLGVLTMFLLVSKVHSPQYALWIAPFLALLDVPYRRVLAYLATDLAVFVSGFYFFTVMNEPAPAWQGIFEAAVLARTAAIAWVAHWAFRASRVRPELSEESA